MKKFNTFYVLLAVVLVIVFLKTSCMGDAKQQDDPALKTKAVLENIAARKSVRKYLKKEVEEEKITAMLKAGMAAPSGMDRRPWEFVVVTDRAALDSMAASLPYAKCWHKHRWLLSFVVILPVLLIGTWTVRQ